MEDIYTPSLEDSILVDTPFMDVSACVCVVEEGSISVCDLKHPMYYMSTL